MKDEPIDILVVTATLGDRETLLRTIKSVAEVGEGRIKHILTAPKKRCSKLQEAYPDLEILPEPDNCTGIFCALNYAFRKYAPNYKYITFINDDDYWLPDFKFIIQTMRENNDVDVAYGKVKFVDECNKFIKYSSSSKRYKSFANLLRYNITLLTQQATLHRSSLFLELDGFNENHKLVADSEYWMFAIEKNKKFKQVDRYCAAYMIQDGQLSSDTESQQKEISELFINKKYNVILSFFDIILFRLENSKTYLQRLFCR